MIGGCHIAEAAPSEPALTPPDKAGAGADPGWKFLSIGAACDGNGLTFLLAASRLSQHTQECQEC